MTPFAAPSPGTAKPLGATPQKEGTNFALFSDNATGVDLCLFSDDGSHELARLALPAHTDGVWHGFVAGVSQGQLYGYRVHGPYAPQEGHRFNANKLLLDPYAKRLTGEFIFDKALYGFDPDSEEKDLSFSESDSAPFMPKCVVTSPNFRWGSDASPDIPADRTILYEAHIKGVSKRNKTVPVKKRGTFEGLSSPKMLDHLARLGVTSVELLPVQAFVSEPRLVELGLTNYWGYNPVAYFIPEPSYLGPAGVHSFQRMVKALHSAGIEVILDVVYNHTAESWELGPTLSWRGIDNKSYYRLEADSPRHYVNDTGCGNTLNVAHPRVLQMVMDSLRYWVTEMHVDGFRFDLATTVARTDDGFQRQGAFLSAIAQDPVLSGVKLIAEPWDIGPDGYQLGSFPPGWLEWNDQFRDATRAFWRSDPHTAPDLAGCLLGSANLFDHGGRKPTSSVNFVTSHDGFTMRDVASYSHKHNEANQEGNRDGHNHNLSDNCGIEGPTGDLAIQRSRARRVRNLMATLLLSQGTPMLLAGDEIGHTQKGNNNAYCQDNEITWLNWDGADKSLYDFSRQLIALRQKHSALRQGCFMHGDPIDGGDLKDVSWLLPNGRELSPSDWQSADLQALGLMIAPDDTSEVVLIVLNTSTAALSFHLPDMPGWRKVLDTALRDAEFTVEVCRGPAYDIAPDSVTLFTTVRSVTSHGD
ncbi:glycogen debranching protein GlgX [Kordiimonas sp.]|uniref:glycogen debranching protein GlgX n=1 Tax=Kordiimonas sp. TaxID=1970157 RepID=UPI003A921766